MKKYSNRPALKAAMIWRMITDDKIAVEAITETGVFSFRLMKGRPVYQTWLKSEGSIRKYSVQTYLRKGLILIPMWHEVPSWEISYYESKNIDLRSQGIFTFRNRWYRATYMQVEDIDHAIRQQDHIIESYTRDGIARRLRENFENNGWAAEILVRVGERKTTFAKTRVNTQITLRRYRRSLRSILDHSLLFREHKTSGKPTIIATVKKIANGCRSYELCFRPIYRRLQYAARSLECSLKYIRGNHLKSAKKHIEAALRNLEYPDPV